MYDNTPNLRLYNTAAANEDKLLSAIAMGKCFIIFTILLETGGLQL